MKKFRVYQNMTEFAIEVEAKNKKQAIEFAKKLPSVDWEPCDANIDNIFYDCVEYKNYL